jgi:hypothetical protein
MIHDGEGPDHGRGSLWRQWPQQSLLLGRADVLLSVGLGIAYLIWAAAAWRDNPGRVLPVVCFWRRLAGSGTD